MNRYAFTIFALSSVCFVSPAAAQDKLPTELAGTSMFSGSHRAVVSPWSIAIDSQGADGMINGTMSFGGVRCRFKDLPFTGIYKDGTLEIAAPATSPTCGAWKIKMSRPNSAEFAFEGSAISEGNPTTSVSLKPR